MRRDEGTERARESPEVEDGRLKGGGRYRVGNGHTGQIKKLANFLVLNCGLINKFVRGLNSKLPRRMSRIICRDYNTCVARTYLLVFYKAAFDNCKIFTPCYYFWLRFSVHTGYGSLKIRT
jgi:hypothetical protein